MAASPEPTSKTASKLLIALGIGGYALILCLACASLALGGAILVNGPSYRATADAAITRTTDSARPTAVAEAPAPTPTPAPTATRPQPTRPATAVPTSTPRPTLTPVAADSSLQSTVLDEVLERVRAEYVYADYDAAGFEQRCEVIRKKIDAGLSAATFDEEMVALVESLNDDHSYFLTAAEVREEEQGSFVGIGISTELNIDKRYVFIERVFPDSPAARAGLKPHEHILAIDGEPSIDASGKSQTWRMRGDAATDVVLTLRRPGETNTRDVTVTRGDVLNVAEVEARLLPGPKKIAYLMVPSFDESDITVRTRRALQRVFRAAGGRVDGIIIDLRVNPGGRLSVMNDHLEFFTSGDLGRFVERDGAMRELRAAPERIGNSQVVKIVVLIGPSSASASEVFAGSLRAAEPDRVTLVGLPSAGNIESLSRNDLSDGAVLWLATAQFQLPDGSSWEGVGLQPEVTVNARWDEISPDADPVIDAALALFK